MFLPNSFIYYFFPRFCSIIKKIISFSFIFVFFMFFRQNMENSSFYISYYFHNLYIIYNVGKSTDRDDKQAFNFPTLHIICVMQFNLIIYKNMIYIWSVRQDLNLQLLSSKPSELPIVLLTDRNRCRSYLLY